MGFDNLIEIHEKCSIHQNGWSSMMDDMRLNIGYLDMRYEFEMNNRPKLQPTEFKRIFIVW